MACNKLYECIDDWLINRYVSVNESFRILQLNIRGINDLAKFDGFKNILRRYALKIDVIVLCETWITEDCVGLYKIDGYEGIFSCRSVSNGGLAVYVRSDLTADVRRNIIVGGFHHIYCCIGTQRAPIHIHAIYRPPSFDVRQYFFEIENMLANIPKGCDCIFVGDMNIPTT